MSSFPFKTLYEVQGSSTTQYEVYELRIKVLKRGVLVYVKALSKRVIRTLKGCPKLWAVPVPVPEPGPILGLHD